MRLEKPLSGKVFFKSLKLIGKTAAPRESGQRSMVNMKNADIFNGILEPWKAGKCEENFAKTQWKKA
jgi:hypothetical protein